MTARASTRGLPIEIRGLSKHFGPVLAVDDLSFTVEMRSMPGVWVTFALAFPLTVLIIVAVLAAAGGFPGHTFYFVSTLGRRRELLGAGYFGIEVPAPIIGVLCITGEYRHKTMTTSLVLIPVRTRVVLAKVIATAIWAIFIALLGLVAVAAVALPWNAASAASRHR